MLLLLLSIIHSLTSLNRTKYVFAKKIENHDPATRLRYFGSTNLDLLLWPQSPIFKLLKPTEDWQLVIVSLADGFSFDVTFERI